MSRTASLIGEDALASLRASSVLIFGLGGVGGAVCEALARAGVGKLVIVDNDTVAQSNLNRQLIAVKSTIGMRKVDAAELRIKEISEVTEVEKLCVFADESNIEKIISSHPCSFIVDAIDSVGAKVEIIDTAQRYNIPEISCMGTGNRVSSAGFAITDIQKTSLCPLAKAVRVSLRKRGINHATVLSNSLPIYLHPAANIPLSGVKRVPATISYVPNIAGFMLAEYVIKTLLGL